MTSQEVSPSTEDDYIRAADAHLCAETNKTLGN